MTSLVQEALEEMGASTTRMDAIRRAPNFGVAQILLDALKTDVKAAYKRLAFQYHPDRNPGDLIAEAKFKVLGLALNEIQQLSVRPVVTARSVQRVIFVWDESGAPQRARPFSSADAFRANPRPNEYTTNGVRVVFLKPLK